MDAVLSQVKSFATSASENARKDIISSLRNLANSLETPDDTMERIMFLHLQVAAVRAAIDLKLVQLLADTQTPLTVDDLAQKTGAAPLLLTRLYLASIGDVEEVGKNTFTSNSITKTLAKPGNQAGVIHCFDTVGPMFQEMPTFLKKTKYQDNTVLQDAFYTDPPVFLWLPSRPEFTNSICTWLLAERECPPGSRCTPLNRKPKTGIQLLLSGSTSAEALATNAPSSKPNTPAFQGQWSTTFFTPNSIKGAKHCYMRGILHDFPDDKARLILQNIMVSMGRDSVILIDDMVLLETHAHWQATQVDLIMMCALAAMERTMEQWQALLDSVGVKLGEDLRLHPFVP